jgi:hypothetical protein
MASRVCDQSPHWVIRWPGRARRAGLQATGCRRLQQATVSRDARRHSARRSGLPSSNSPPGLQSPLDRRYYDTILDPARRGPCRPTTASWASRPPTPTTAMEGRVPVAHGGRLVPRLLQRTVGIRRTAGDRPATGRDEVASSGGSDGTDRPASPLRCQHRSSGVNRFEL